MPTETQQNIVSANTLVAVTNSNHADKCQDKGGKFDLNVKIPPFIENNSSFPCTSQIKCLTLHQENKIINPLKKLQI